MEEFYLNKLKEQREKVIFFFFRIKKKNNNKKMEYLRQEFKKKDQLLLEYENEILCMKGLYIFLFYFLNKKKKNL